MGEEVPREDGSRLNGRKDEYIVSVICTYHETNENYGFVNNIVGWILL